MKPLEYSSMVIEFWRRDPAKEALPGQNFDTYLTLRSGPLAEGLQRPILDGYLSGNNGAARRRRWS